MHCTENDIVACICEGSSEKNIIHLLLQNNLLIFSEEQLLQGKVLTGPYRKSDKFTDQFLTMDYGEQEVVIFIIQDNKTSFLIRKPYSNKIRGPHIVVTAPEIEMLMIHSLGLYNQYQKVKKSKKPSIFVAEHLKKTTSKIKSTPFILEFYQKYDLKESLILHKRKAKNEKGSFFLADFLK
ncbi:hypothetical protein [Listeria cornellensis]|uniref:Uncharacterized protein n=1 Tax=Listeria cornellensis FSL F6-0969 TaxID=1265820 RepID=W7C2L7_9LIST|nr:hypothetical protein [Listeria cornellensis]EUJ31287.1 hypothetical protein PCORN_05688 [Listeria cornellensis FSL F6-0969]